MTMDFRESDLAELGEIAKNVGETTGLNLGGDWTEILKFVDQLISMFNKHGGSIMDTVERMRRFESGSGSAPPEADFVPSMDNPSPPPRLAQPATVSPERVYALALGALAQLPQDMTIADALSKAKAAKLLIIPKIAEELTKLQAGDTDD